MSGERWVATSNTYICACIFLTKTYPDVHHDTLASEIIAGCQHSGHDARTNLPRCHWLLAGLGTVALPQAPAAVDVDKIRTLKLLSMVHNKYVLFLAF